MTLFQFGLLAVIVGVVRSCVAAAVQVRFGIHANIKASTSPRHPFILLAMAISYIFMANSSFSLASTFVMAC